MSVFNWCVLCSCDYCSFVVGLKSEHWRDLQPCSCFKGCFGSLRSLESPCGLQDGFFCFCKTRHLDLGRACPGSVITLGGVGILIILSLLAHEHEFLSVFLRLIHFNAFPGWREHGLRCGQADSPLDSCSATRHRLGLETTLPPSTCVAQAPPPSCPAVWLGPSPPLQVSPPPPPVKSTPTAQHPSSLYIVPLWHLPLTSCVFICPFMM